MPPLDEYAVNPREIEQGVVALKNRQHRLMLLGVTTTMITIVSIISLFLHQELVFGFFGLSTEVQQLHLPVSVDANLASLGDSPDYFLNLLSWFGWLILKLFASFIGAFFVVHFLKKIRYFYVKFQSFVQKFVGWLIAFILIWSGLTYWQHDLNGDHDDAYQKVVYYDSNINDSEMARYLSETEEVAAPVKSYLLAQTALLHNPADLSAARPHVSRLIQTEKNDKAFEEYGFKPEQLWTMQQQVYGKTMTSLAETVTPQVQQASHLESWVKILIWMVLSISAVLSLIFYGLANIIKKRSLRIEQRIH
ncbi:hypothetical protein [Acinetobacter thermotolerans]|uniref:hypothetical protein n=1 Tax=Acinetobacter thermotolerans TaxID=3151487 RepID=UPI00325B161C